MNKQLNICVIKYQVVIKHIQKIKQHKNIKNDKGYSFKMCNQGRLFQYKPE